jgi:outer membrane lipoprotein LolB
MPGVDLTVVDEGFALTGRFAIRHAQEGGSGRIEWRHTASTDDLLVSTPIGQGLARVTRRDGVYEITTREQQAQRAVDPQALTEKMLGWRLPLEGLPDWVRGRPAPDLPARFERDAQGRLAWIEQQGWRIDYQQYRDAMADTVQGSSVAPAAALPLRLSSICFCMSPDVALMAITCWSRCFASSTFVMNCVSMCARMASCVYRHGLRRSKA